MLPNRTFCENCNSLSLHSPKQYSQVTCGLLSTWNVGSVAELKTEPLMILVFIHLNLSSPMWLEATVKHDVISWFRNVQATVSTSTELNGPRRGEDTRFDHCHFEIGTMTCVPFYFPDSNMWLHKESAQNLLPL